MKLYAGQEGHVLTDKKSKHIVIGKGTKQEDPISPNLFNATLEHDMRKIKPNTERKRWGINVGLEGLRYLTNLRFADDVLLDGRYSYQVSACFPN